MAFTAMDAAEKILAGLLEMAEKEEKDFFREERVVVQNTTMLLEDLVEEGVHGDGEGEEEAEVDILEEHQVITNTTRVEEEVDHLIMEGIV